MVAARRNSRRGRPKERRWGCAPSGAPTPYDPRQVDGSFFRYWRFYWPLALTGVAMVLGHQFQNAVLARYPEAVTELAVFALASGTFALFHAGLNFTAQLSNVYARSAVGTLRSRRFVAASSVALMLPLLVLIHTEAGLAGIGRAYGIDRALVDRVAQYLNLMAPLLFVTGQRTFYTGVLVQSHLTRWVTALHAGQLATTVLALLAGFAVGLPAVYTLVGAQATAAVAFWAASAAVYRAYYTPPEVPEHEHLRYRELFRFFWPMTITGLMFATSRPVLFAFVSRTPDGLASIAALRVAFDFCMMFQQAANQFRHFFVTFGLDELPAKRRFMAIVGAGITLLMAAVALTPLSHWVLEDAMGIPDPVLSRSVDVILVMCLLPSIILIRNFYHGHLMVKRRTGGMAVGGILRVLGIWLVAQALYSAGLLDHIAAAFTLLLGFVLETVLVFLATLRAEPSWPASRQRDA
jgi:hypothetical protein